jgi:DNA-binding response OmpR family regulator
LAPATSLALTREPVPRKSALMVVGGAQVNAMVSRVLRDEGLEISRAVDNKTVLSIVRERSFDLIITAEHTDAKEDVELLHAIRNIRPHVRMIVLADEATPSDVIAAIRAGAFSYFRPPYTASELSRMVRLAMSEPAWDDGIEIVSATSSWVRLIVRADLPTADRLVQFLRAGSTLPEGEKDDVISAFHEILLNAMEHGAHFDPSQYVEVAFVRTRRMMVCRVKDPGQGFSLEEIRQHTALEDSPQGLFNHLHVREEQGLRPGGFGLMLARKLVDEVLYSEEGNDVLLVKYLEQPSPPPDPLRKSSPLTPPASSR